MSQPQIWPQENEKWLGWLTSTRKLLVMATSTPKDASPVNQSPKEVSTVEPAPPAEVSGTVPTYSWTTLTSWTWSDSPPVSQENLLSYKDSVTSVSTPPGTSNEPAPKSSESSNGTEVSGTKTVESKDSQAPKPEKTSCTLSVMFSLVAP